MSADKKAKEVHRNVRLLAMQLHEYEKVRFRFYKKFLIKGFLAWQIIKRPLFYSLIRDSYSFESEGVSSVKKTKKYFRPLFLFPFRLVGLRLRKKPIVFIFSSEVVKYEKDSQGRDINNYADHWYSYQPSKEVVYVENSSGRKDPANGVIRPDVDLSFISPFVRAIIRIGGSFAWKESSVKAIAYDLAEHSGIEGVTAADFQEKIRSIISKFLLDYYIYRFIFWALNPKVLVVTDAVGSGIMAAAMRANMKIIENQHGHFDKYKPDYIMNQEQMLEVRHLLVMPHALAVFGPYFKKFLLENSIWQEEEVIPVGNIRIDMYRSTNKTMVGSTKIVIPTQWTYFNETIALLNKLLSYPATDPLEIIIKPHPREPQKHIEAFTVLASQNKSLAVANAEESIYELFRNCNLVIGFDSTSLYESVALGIPTVTMTTRISTRGIHTFGNQDELLLKAIRLAKPENIQDLLDLWFQDRQFRESWLTDIKGASDYLYSSNCVGNCATLMNNLKKA